MQKALCILTLTFVSITSYAQKEPASNLPVTKLEQFLSQHGVVIIQGTAQAESLVGAQNTLVTVWAKELLNVSDNKKEYGMTVKVTETSATGVVRENTSYVDYDEIDPLIQGIDYLLKRDKNAVKLSNFDASYSTKDNLEFFVYMARPLPGIRTQNKPRIFLLVRSGKTDVVRAIFVDENIGKVRDLIIALKELLDSIKK